MRYLGLLGGLALLTPLQGVQAATSSTTLSTSYYWWIVAWLLVLAIAVMVLGVLYVLPASRPAERDIDADLAPNDGGYPSAVGALGEMDYVPNAGAGDSLAVYRGKHILVAEDNLTSQLVLKRLLTQLGFQVDIAPNGRRAIELFRENTYSGVLMDLRMPVMDGLSATREIRTTQEGRNVPVIGFTADTSHIDRQLCLDAGMDDHLDKPVRKNDLIRTLARWIEVPVIGESAGRTAPTGPSPVETDFAQRFLARVSEQITEVEPRTIRILADSFLVETKTQLENINRSITQGDWAGIAAAVGRLKETGRDVGADELIHLVEEFEAATAEENQARAGQLLRRVWLEYERLGHVFGEISASFEEGRSSRRA